MFSRLLQSRLAWALLSNGLRVGGYLLVLPIALRRIPEAEMEIWWLFVTVQALAVQADCGLGPSISRGLSYLLAGATSLKPGAAQKSGGVDPAKVGGFMESTRRVYFWVLLAAAGVLVLASFFIVPKIQQLGGGASMLASWAAFAIGVLLSLASVRQTNLLTGADHVRLAQQIQLAGMAANLALTAIGLALGMKFLALALGSLLAGAVQLVCGHWFLRKHLKAYLGPARTEDAAHWFAELWPSAWRAGLVSLGAFLIYNSNTFWASAHLGQPDASRYPLTLRLMQFMMVVCGLPITTQIPRLARMMAAGETREAWSFFLKRHLIGLSAMVLGVLGLWLLGDRLLEAIGSHSRLLAGPFLLFMGLIYILEFNHGYCATLVMTRNEVPFVWAATLSGLAICAGGGMLSEAYGLWGLLGTVFVVQGSWNNWWVPLLAWRSVAPPAKA